MRPFLLAAVFSLTAIGTAQNPLEARLRDLCENHLKKERIVGMTVAILDDSEIVLNDGFGYADREAKRLADERTIVRLGSISKPITAIGLLRLVDLGKLDLDADIRTYVPEFPAKPWPISARHLLTHTSGIRHYVASRRDTLYETVTTEEGLKRFSADPLMFEPGVKFSYSTHAFTLVARAIEQVDGRHFVEYMREEVFPAAGGDLDFEVAGESKPTRSALYLKTAGAAKLSPRRENLSWKYGGGGMESTAIGVARFADAIRRGEILETETRDRMWTATTLKDGKPNAYGLGWRVATNGRVSHSGSQQGAATYLLIDPKREIVIAVLANTEKADVVKLAQVLLSAVLEQRKPVGRPKGRTALDVPKRHPLSSR
jgi:CubicO group peptidase (beta-lactamase class C family)